MITSLKTLVKKDSYPFLLILALASIPFLSTLWFVPLNIDDPVFVFRNPMIVNFSVSSIFEPVMGFYQPVFNLIIGLLGKIGGQPNPFIFHFFNIACHALNAILVYIIIRHLFNEKTAFWVACIFAVHPLQAETVAWLTTSRDLIMGFFFLLSFYCWDKFLATDLKKFAWIALLAGLMALGSKVQAVSLIGVWILLSLWREKQIFWPVILIFASVSVLDIFLTFNQIESMGWLELYGQRSITERMSLTAVAILSYAGLFIYPHPLTLVYGFPILTYFDYFLILGLTIMFIVALIKSRRQYPIWWFCLGLFLCLIIPTSHLVAHTPSFLNNRFMYLAIIPLALLLVSLISKRVLYVLFAFLIGCLSLLLLNLPHWRNHQAVISHVIHHFPYFSQGYLQKANEYLKSNQTDKALHELSLCEAYNPKAVDCFVVESSIHINAQDYPKAISSLTKAINLSPQTPLYLNRSIAYAQIGENTRALEDLNVVIESKSSFTAMGYFNRYQLYKRLGQINEAHADCLNARQLRNEPIQCPLDATIN